MKVASKYLFAAFLVYILGTVTYTQSLAQTWEPELYFRNISTDDGLSNPTVNCFLEDARGYIWIGTVDGLNRYDGNEFKVFRPNPTDSNSIPSYRINTLYEDSDHNLWIGTSEGLCRYNYKLEEFVNYKGDEDFAQIYDIAHDKKNNWIWFVSSLGNLNYLDVETGIITSFAKDIMTKALAYRLIIIDGFLYIGTSKNGLYKLNLETLTIAEFCNTNGGSFRLLDNWTTALDYYDKNILIGTEKGLVVYQIEDDKTTYYNSENSLLPSANVTSLAHDSDGNIYIGTDNGLAILHYKSQMISAHRQEEGNLTALSSNLIRALLVDKNDDLWIGTIQRGINYMNIESRKMTVVRKDYENKNSLSDNSISCITSDDEGGIWIGTNQNGLNYYKNGKYQFFKADGLQNSLSNNKVTDLCVGDDKVVWIATYGGGLNAYQNGKFTQYEMGDSDFSSIGSNKIRMMDIDRDGNLWLATLHGIESFDIEKETFTQYIFDTGDGIITDRINVRSLLIDYQGNVFAGTNKGLYIYDPISGKSEYFHSDPNDSNALGNNIIIEIFEDSKKRIWLGSLGGGLIHFDRKTKTFKSHTTLNGFPDNSVKSIEEDENGELWMGTNKGIVKFSPSTEQIVTFGKSYGLQNNVFNINASFKCDDGRMLFGGIQGFNVFWPENLELENSKLDVIITDLKLFDKSVPVNSQNNILTKNISLTDSISLLYQQAKYFSINLSALQFSNPDQVQYKYMLEGFDKDWSFIGNDHRLSFRNLEPGNYVLKLMASENGIWDNKIKEIQIEIEPPIYMQTWFNVTLALILVLLLVAFYFYKLRAHKIRQIILKRLVEKKSNEISDQNEELLSVNEELLYKNDKIGGQKEFIASQNKELNTIHGELKLVNQNLEKRVESRTKELKETNLKLNKTVNELDRFVYSASHDLSAPLKSILGVVNIAKMENDHSKQKNYWNYIEECIGKEEKVIRGLIQYSRNSRQKIDPKPLKLFELINQTIEELRYMPGSDRVKIINHVDENVVITMDEQRMTMILNNLLSNGIKYSNIYNDEAFVKVKIDEKIDSWSLNISDNGQGVPDDHHDKIFEMFHRATVTSDGSGLGLFIVKEAVERLGGQILLTSTFGVGSEFEMHFPYM